MRKNKAGPPINQSSQPLQFMIAKVMVLEVRGDLNNAGECVLQLSRLLESFHQCLVSFERSVTLAAFVVAGPLI